MHILLIINRMLDDLLISAAVILEVLDFNDFYAVVIIIFVSNIFSLEYMFLFLYAAIIGQLFEIIY